MPKFLILAVETNDMFGKYSAAEMRAIEKRYYAWTKALAKKGALVDGSQLVDRRVVEANGAKPTVRTANAKETWPGGYWMVKAKNLEAAAKLCEDCPHLGYGTVQVLQMG